MKPPPRNAIAGFSLMEVLVAATIFMIVLAALTVTFRTGVKAWETGHSGSEIFQAARITQDILTRDLNNLFYRTESDYNRNFRAQMARLGEYNSGLANAQNASGDEQAALMQALGSPPVAPEDMPVPIDLSFHGNDGDQLDSISFTVRQMPKAGYTPQKLGIIRVKYFVKEGTLFRQESNIYGLRPGTELKNYLSENPEMKSIADGYISPESAEEAGYEIEVDEQLAAAAGGNEAGAAMTNPIDEPPVTEPLCEGVEIFDIQYGYFHEEEWTETDTWDSAGWSYRFPKTEEDLLGYNSPAFGGAPGGGESNFNAQMRGARTAFVRGQQVTYTTQPDDLPGYIAVQVGIRGADKKGRLHRFTFYCSCPIGQETFDPSMADDPRDGPGRRQGNHDDKRAGSGGSGGGGGGGGGLQGLPGPGLGGNRGRR